MSGKKFLTMLLVQATLLGAAAGGGIYWYRQRDKGPAQLATCQGDLKKGQKLAAQLLARNFLLEAEVGLLHENPGFAFERVLRAQMTIQGVMPELQPAFDEMNGLLVAQNAKAKEQLLHLAEKIISLDAPKEEAPKTGTKPAADKPGPVAKAPDGKPVKPEAKPEAKIDPPPATLQAAPRPAAQDEAYRSILDAKTGLLAGGAEAQGAVSKLARARVMLDEAGRSDLGQELDVALSAAKRKDETKARAAIDAVLAKLR